MSHSVDRIHVAKLQSILDSLFAEKPVLAGDFKSPKRGITSPVYAQRQYQGIYVFTDEDDKEIIYIGKTNDGIAEKAISDRIWGHLAGASAISAVVTKDRRPELNVRTFEVDDRHLRGCAELYGIAVYRPKANRISKTTATVEPAQA